VSFEPEAGNFPVFTRDSSGSLPTAEQYRSLVGRHVSELPTPSLIIDPTILESNVSRMALSMGELGVALRPHWKASKCIPVGRAQLAAGAVGLTCATAAEVEALVTSGVRSIFWAYPPVGPQRVRLAVTANQFAEVIVGGDNADMLRSLSEAASASEVTVPVRIAVDTGLGRTGVRPELAAALAREVSALPSIDFRGIYTHEGHVQAQGPDAELREKTATAAGALMVEVAETIRRSGVPVTDVSVGSTPGGAITAAVPGITEARPGTYVYGDDNQVSLGTVLDTQCAAFVLARVVSTERGETTIIDAGIKAMSSDGSMRGDNRIGTIVAPVEGVVFAGHEEHGFARGISSLSNGDLVRIRPNHACGLSNMHSHAFVVDGDRVTDVWPIVGRH
jgi:D-serine deaminase-like pyridoxal phosphate-dependent protein